MILKLTKKDHTTCLVDTTGLFIGVTAGETIVASLSDIEYSYLPVQETLEGIEQQIKGGGTSDISN